MSTPAQTTPPRPATYAAVDLGSNSFHLLVTQRVHGELQVLDRIKEMVQLGGGLDEDGRLDEETRARAFDCLSRFGQRLRGIPEGNVRAVGTQTLRRMHNASAFLVVAETALGCPIEVIAGREEARLIYLGVSQGVAGSDERRLVIDIGGGSTELVIGTGVTPADMESLQFGCVSLTRRYFGDGRIEAQRWRRARDSVLAELQELRSHYLAVGWDRAIGSSGTIRAVEAACLAMGWTERHITAGALDQLVAALLACGHVDNIDLAGLSERRRRVIAGGVVILSACFEALELDTLLVSPYALREGVLHDLLGRLEHRDPRDKTVKAFMARYGVDREQAERVRAAAFALYDQLAAALGLREAFREFLGWAAELHETGLGISHSHYQRHSGYLVQESDMAGFSRQEQAFLAALVRNHRRAILPDHAEPLPARLRAPLRYLLLCLRLACILCRTRSSARLPPVAVTRRDQHFRLEFPADWLEGHPLTVADLEAERAQLQALGLELEFGAEAA